MSSKRSQWSEFDKEERKYIKKRDKEKCVICGARGGLQIMHIFVNRGHGGKGERRNGCLGCVNCHRVMDNPIGDAQIALSKEYLDKCKKHLIEIEHIEIPEAELRKELIFNRERDGATISVTLSPTPVRDEPKCKDCVFLVKDRRNNSTIPTYFCKRHYCGMARTRVACTQFEERTTSHGYRN